MKTTAEQQEETEIEQEGRIYLIGWESLVQKRKKKPKGMKRGNKKERILLMRIRNHFQSGSTLSAAKYTEKSLMGRKQTELLVYGFITEANEIQINFSNWKLDLDERD